MANKQLNIKTTSKGTRKAAKELDKVDNTMKNMAKSALKFGAAYFGARGVIRALKSSVQAAGEQELAEKKLETALGRTSQTLLNQATALQQVTTYGDENIISAQALIASFVKDEEQVKAATKATLDLAAAKGFDLVSAADLVSKTLGSPTNALTRYGIEVEGAVGSSERLESLTTNIAKVFGGQATAQAETMTGAMQQAKNAIGDTAEQIGFMLSPIIVDASKTIKGLAETVGGWIAIDTATKLRDEQDEFNALISILQDANVAQSTRNSAISELQNKYGEYIGNIDLEKATYKELEVSIRNANKEFENKIMLAAAEDALKEYAKAITDVKLELFNLEKKTRMAKDGSVAFMGGMMLASDATIKNALRLSYLQEKLVNVKTAYQDAKDALLELTGAQEDKGDADEEESEKGRIKISLLEKEHELKMRLVEESNPAFIESMEEVNGLLETEGMGTQAVIDQWEKWESTTGRAINTSLGAFDKYTSAAKQNMKARMDAEISALKDTQIYREADAEQRESMEEDVRKTYSDEARKLFRIEQTSNLASIAMDTASAVMKAYKLSPATFGLPWTAIIAGAGIAQAATVLSQTPPSYAMGGEFLTTGPQQIIVGDNPGGIERVSVEPVSSTGLNRSNNLTINIQGDFIGTEENADRLAEIIEERSRLGFNNITVA